MLGLDFWRFSVRFWQWALPANEEFLIFTDRATLRANFRCWWNDGNDIRYRLIVLFMSRGRLRFGPLQFSAVLELMLRAHLVPFFSHPSLLSAIPVQDNLHCDPP